MKTKLILFLVLSLSVSFVGVLATSSQLFIVARIDSSTFYEGDMPTVTGKITDQSRTPVQGALISVNYPFETVNATSGAGGVFKIIPTKPASVGEYGISITANKDGYDMGTSVMEYSVLEKPSEAIDVDGIQKGVQDVGTMMVSGLTKNPIAEILAQQMELAQKQQKAFEQRQAEIKKQDDLLGEQRKIVNDSLQEDLVQMGKDTELYNPFNAFSRFVSDVDSSVKNIFWGQFNLTQQQYAEAHKAKMDALENQQDSKNAMKIYQEKAAVSRDTIIKLNNDLNLKYGNNTQSLSNSQGNPSP